MEIEVLESTLKVDTITSVVYTGDPVAARLLVEHGWLSGADMGFGRDDAGDHVLRGLIESDAGLIVVFPGDVIVRYRNGKLEAFEAQRFLDMFDLVKPVLILTNEVDEPPEPSPIPTGENPEAVNLEKEHWWQKK